jgi:hypothetical protein
LWLSGLSKKTRADDLARVESSKDETDGWTSRI